MTTDEPCIAIDGCPLSEVSFGNGAPLFSRCHLFKTHDDCDRAADRVSVAKSQRLLLSRNASED
jgi:hypothetical protein